MPIQKLDFKPGIDRDNTGIATMGGWYDCDKIRFRMGRPEIIGGWVKYNQIAFLGTARSLHPWTTLSGTSYFGMGTHLKYYLATTGAYYDITPIRKTTSPLANNAITTLAAGSKVVTIADTAHGAIASDFVTISGATGPIDGIPAAEINANHQITTVVDSNSYRVTMPTTAATTGGVSGGGAAIVVAYEINTGLNTTLLGDGWGAGTWGRGTWGSAATTLTTGDALRLWSEDNFGEDLLFNVRDGGIYRWDASAGTGTRAVNITSILGSSGAPTVCRRVIVSDEDRHLLALGCNEIGETAQDKMLIRWPDAESLTVWTPDTINEAGSLRLSVGSQIITGFRTKQETLVWTDTALHSLRWVGPPFIFGVRLLSAGTNIISPEAMGEADSVVYWMGRDGFFAYSGSVKTLHCTVRRFVFENINESQYEKVHMAVNRAFNEVTWFYCSALSSEIDRYVTFNYVENSWYFGAMVRTVWHDSVFSDHPIAAANDGYLYQHEKNWSDGSTSPASAIPAYIESSDFAVGDGFHLQFIKRLHHDITFNGSTAAAPAVTMTLTPRDFQGEAYRTGDASTVTASSTVYVEQFTKQSHIRVRGRFMQLRVASSGAGVFWRYGSPGMDVRMDGRR